MENNTRINSSQIQQFEGHHIRIIGKLSHNDNQGRLTFEASDHGKFIVNLTNDSDTDFTLNEFYEVVGKIENGAVNQLIKYGLGADFDVQSYEHLISLQKQLTRVF